MSVTQPWRDGTWTVQGQDSSLIIINGPKYELKGLIHLNYPEAKAHLFGTLEWGDFGDTPENIRQATGIGRFNMQLKNQLFESKGVLTEDGTRIHKSSYIPGAMDIMEWADENKLHQLKENREPLDAPSIPPYYTKDSLRKNLWFTGPPGSGKSTSAQLMGRLHGYIYYEGDAYYNYVNPFVDVNAENPTMAIGMQKPLKGIPADVIKIMDKSSEGIQNMLMGIFDGLEEVMVSALPPLAQHVVQQRKRLGGDIAVACGSLFSRKARDIARKHLGEDLVIFVLNMTPDSQKARLDARHEGTALNLDVFKKMYEIYELAGDDEKNAFNLTITEKMSPEDVIAEVQKILEKL